jgi:hypothetical protein
MRLTLSDAPEWMGTWAANRRLVGLNHSRVGRRRTPAGYARVLSNGRIGMLGQAPRDDGWGLDGSANLGQDSTGRNR